MQFDSYDRRKFSVSTAHGYPCHALDPAKENIHALESLNRYIVWGCWELKRKFRLRRTYSQVEWAK